MTFRAFRGNAFEHSHENHAFNRLHDLLQAEWASRDEALYLWGNFYVEGRELDALIVKRNAIIVVDLKDYGGRLSFSENGRWTIDGVEVKGGSSVNPYQQIRTNKFNLLRFIERRSGLQSTPNLRHIAGLALFHRDIQFDADELPYNISRWFHVADLGHAIRSVDAMASREIDLPVKDLDALAEAFDLPRYHPDGGPATVEVAGRSMGETAKVRWSDAQQEVLDKAGQWLADEKTLALVLEGMVSTGKRTLLPPLIGKIGETGQAALLVAPNSRIAQRYATSETECRSIYSLLYSSNMDEVVDGRAHHPVHLKRTEVEGRVLVFVEAHLLSNSFFAMDTVIYGSGHILDDLLDALGEHPPKMLISGDPFQLSRGDLELSLLNTHSLQTRGHAVERVTLNEQIRPADSPVELLDFQKGLANGLMENHFNRLPTAGSEQVCEYRPDQDAETLGNQLIAGYFNAVYLCGKNELAQKVNQATRARHFGTTSMRRLVEGDRVDFHNRTPVLEEAEDPFEIETKWLYAGNIGIVESAEQETETRTIRLGPDRETVVDFATASIRVPGAGTVRIRYLPAYLAAPKPELSQDQQLAMLIWARQAAEGKLSSRKASLAQLKQSGAENYKAEKCRYGLEVHRLMMSDSYLNAARLRFAYAMTVHRAQGRSWQHVIVNAQESSDTTSPNNGSYFRWLYTATTCTDDRVTLLKYPRLDPLVNAQWKPNPQCQFGPVQVRRQYPYDRQRVLSEADKRMKPPPGLVNLQQELVAMMLGIHDALQGSAWHIGKMSQHDYQEHYLFVSDTDERVVGRFTYNADYTVTNVSLKVESGDESCSEELWAVLKPARVFRAWEVEEAVGAVEARIGRAGFALMTVEEKPYRASVIVQHEDGAVQLELNVNKGGMVSSVRPLKAANEALLAALEAVFTSESSSAVSDIESTDE